MATGKAGRLSSLRNIDEFLSQFLCGRLFTGLFRYVPVALEGKGAREVVMALLTILEIAGLVAIALLLTCLKGFRRALRHKKISGVFVTFEKERRLAPRGPSKTLVDFSHRKSQPARDPGRQHISGGTVPLMSLVIALGAHHLPGQMHSLSSQRETTRVPGVQPPQSS